MLSTIIKELPFTVLLETNSAVTSMEYCSSQTWKKDGAELTIQNHKLLLLAPVTPVQHITMSWKVQHLPGMRYLGDHWERGYGDLEWRGLVPERKMPWTLLRSDGRRLEGVGVKTNPTAFCFWTADGHALHLHLDLRSGSQGVILGPRQLHLATLVHYESKPEENPFEAACSFYQRNHTDPVRLPSYPVYGANDWYFRYGENSRETVLLDGALAAELALSSTNRPFMIIDDGWQKRTDWDNDAGGEHLLCNDKFRDMAKLAVDLKKEGLRTGIWTRPLTASPTLSPSLHLPVHGYQRPILDPTLPETLDIVRNNIATLYQWGYELIKHDFTTYDILGLWGSEMGKGITSGQWTFHDRSKTTAEIIRTLYETIRNAAPEALIIGCNTIGHLCAGLFEINRTGNDTSGLIWEKTRQMGVNTLAFRMPQHQIFFAADADCVGLTKKIPWPCNKEWLALLARSNTPLFVSSEPEALGTEQKQALREAFTLAAVPQPRLEPLDWMETTCPAIWKSGNETLHTMWHTYSI